MALLPWGIAGVAAVFAAMPLFRTPPKPLVPARFGIDLPESVYVATGPGGSKIALSADGRQMVIVGRKIGGRPMLYLRRLDDPVAQPIRGTEGAVHAAFAPDGEWIAFNAPGQVIRKVPVAGGTTTDIADSASNVEWGEKDRILFNRTSSRWLTTSGAGDQRRIAGRDTSRNIVFVGHADFLPGGDEVLATIRRGVNTIDSSYLAVISLDDGEITELGMQGTNPRYASSGHIIFARSGGQVFAAPFSQRKRAITGPATLLLQDVSQAPGGPPNVAIAQNGTLAYHVGQNIALATRTMVTVSPQGVEQPLKGGPGNFTDPRVSPDGKRVAFNFRDNGSLQQLQGDVFVHDIATGGNTRVTSSGRGVRAEWSRDGSQLYYIDQPGDSSMIHRRPWDMATGDTVLSRGTSNGVTALNTISVGPPGGWAAFRVGDNTQNTEVWIAPMDSLNARRPFVTSQFRESGGVVSPDGRFLAYASDETGRDEVYVVTLPVAGARVPVSVSGGNEPAWSRDGSKIYFRGPDRMMVATFSARPVPSVTRVDSLFTDVYFRERWNRQYDVMADGRLVMLRSTGDAPQVRSNLYAVVNWQQLLGTHAVSSAR